VGSPKAGTGKENRDQYQRDLESDGIYLESDMCTYTTMYLPSLWGGWGEEMLTNVREGLLKQVALEQRPEGWKGSSHMMKWRKASRQLF
jgi:hypothetical protein